MAFAEGREFKLGKSGCCRVHPYLDDGGAFFGNDAPLLEKDSLDRWRPRPRAALERDLSKALGTSIDLGWRMDSFVTVARALNKGDRSLAAIALVHAELPSLPRRPPQNGATTRSYFRKDAHDVSGEARIPAGQTGAGRWTVGGVLSAAAAINIANLGDEAAAVLANGGRAALAALSDLGAGLAGPVTLATGLMLIPTSTITGNTTEGALADHPDIKYRYAEGELNLWQEDANGNRITIYSGVGDLDGLYRAQDGTVLGRSLDGSIALNQYGILATFRPSEARTEDQIAPLLIPDSDDCRQQWKDAEKYCAKLEAQGQFGAPNQPKSYQGCLGGYVSQDCGGNPVDW
ncbi:MAG TPA: hypothetical protein VGG27_00720 [Magnetospirillaceae bacterium]|jgi:hypothetical protein